jgi:hypothetical protein
MQLGRGTGGGQKLSKLGGQKLNKFGRQKRGKFGRQKLSKFGRQKLSKFVMLLVINIAKAPSQEVGAFDIRDFMF